MPPFHPFCRCRLRARPSLDASMATRAPDGEADFLRALGKDEAAQVMGSHDRAARVMAGTPAKRVIDAGLEPPYRLRTLAEVVRGGHPMVAEGEPA